MAKPRSRFEIVRTDADQPYHVRYRARNSKIVLDSENLARKSSAQNGIKSLAEEFGYEVVRFEDDAVVLVASGGAPHRELRVPVLEVDER